ncbi:cation-transporting P-type ATPase [Chitinolyticbacter meiyuanensis]|uniref:cation-transporting P-type ATPase n=1 Tax=Chitinolyticbacter meiyuanensis TaxID=682798 RepID=UPI0011E5A905|nr:cation-transporting P-type ATPase [Chitinolyticbacter meiyuanensis]
MNQDSPPATAPWYRFSPQETLHQLQSRPDGLSPAEAAERLVQHGANSLPNKPRDPGWLRFARQFNDMLIYVLLVAAVLTALMGHWVDTLVILGVTVVNAAIGFLQENSAEKSLERIRGMLSNHAMVSRAGERCDIDAATLVPGDIVHLKPGDKIPADLRLLEVHDLKVEEAILTGESTVVDKRSAALPGEALIGDRLNLAYSGTTVSAGTACGVVIATGSATELGQINRMMGEVDAITTPLLRQIRQLGKVIFFLILAMMAGLFVYARLLHDIPLGELLLSLISLAVASVPEGLPAIISIILSLGVQRMARNHAIIRKLPTVETLGAMTIVCSDKTGTLTMNEMTVKAVILADGQYAVGGESYDPVGEIRADDGSMPDLTPGTPFQRFITAIHLCNDARLARGDDGRWCIVGAPTAGALQVLAAKAGLQFDDVRQLDKIPFDSAYKYQASHHMVDGEAMVLVTGAPDVIAALCQTEQGAAGPQPYRLDYWDTQITSHAENGLRMLAAAYKPLPADHGELTHDDLKDELVFLGVAGMMDPPRPEAIAAIRQCQAAGIRVKMITGDHQGTAMAIGAMLGIGDGHTAVTGTQLQRLSDEELVAVARDCDIFARTSPEHKLRLVRALQATGNVVGMTGDGVNDAPALKQADVGIAMGIKGTEVTKEAADMVLTDDNFDTIARAVQEGRRVYDNLKKTILFILPTNLGQGLLVLIALLAGATVPLTPLQILWMNMATSVTLSFGLAFEPAEPGLMQRQPRPASANILGTYGIWRIAFVGLMLAACGFVLESQLLARGHDSDFVRTMLLQTLVAGQWAYMFNCRLAERFSLTRAIWRNKGLWLVSGILLLLQLAIVYLPAMNEMFGTTPLPLTYWGISLAIAACLFVVVELEKWLVRKWTAHAGCKGRK